MRRVEKRRLDERRDRKGFDTRESVGCSDRGIRAIMFTATSSGKSGMSEEKESPAPDIDPNQTLSLFTTDIGFSRDILDLIIKFNFWIKTFL